jgi:L-lactate dehydrogenase complex protein LldG
VRTTREAFLARIRGEVRRTPGLFAAAPAERPAEAARVVETIRRELAERWPETIARFQEEFERVGGVFHRAPSIEGAPDVVAEIAAGHGARSIATWPPETLGADLSGALGARGLAPLVMPPGRPDDPDARARLREALASTDLGLTGVDLAIAETGTLVLISGGGRPRSTALLPPVHVAVFDRTALVESLAQTGVFLEAWHAGDALPWRGAAIHFVTGPSRTADIELTLTRGVHGPRDVHAIFVERPFRG